MQCPKCHKESSSDIECSYCGIIFEKYRPRVPQPNDRPRLRLGTIGIWLGAFPLLWLVLWIVINPPCGSLLRSIVDNCITWGTLVAVPFNVVAIWKEKPRKRALIGLAMSMVPLICFGALIAAIVYAVATGGTGIPGKLDIMYSKETGTAFETGVFITTDTKYYDVSGSTLGDLDAQVHSLGPHGFVAETDPYYHWYYTYRLENGACRIDRVRIDARLTFTYPRWNNPDADPKVTEEWQKRLVQLERHEGEHEGIARQTSKEIYDTLAQLPPAQSCGELQKEIETRAQSVLAKARERDDEFDRVTDHGKRSVDATP